MANKKGLLLPEKKYPGRKISPEVRAKIASSLRGNTNAHHRGDRQSFYRGIRMDSSWEVKVAGYLDQNSISWKYGSTVFKIDDKRSYRPDFELENGSFIEVKGYWREKNRRKFLEFLNLYPSVIIEVWDKDVLKKLGILPS